MEASNRAPRRTSDVRVNAEDRPGWITGTERPPSAGERVYTHEGPGVVARVLGKTGTAGRLLEVTMDDGRKHLFFTTDANVMVEQAASRSTNGAAGGDVA